MQPHAPVGLTDSGYKSGVSRGVALPGSPRLTPTPPPPSDPLQLRHCDVTMTPACTLPLLLTSQELGAFQAPPSTPAAVPQSHFQTFYSESSPLITATVT